MREGGCEGGGVDQDSDKETGDGLQLVGSHGTGLILSARVLVEQGTLPVGQEEDLGRWNRRMTWAGGAGRGRQPS